MRIAHITPGTGGTFYCQNCFRDGELLESLIELGHEVHKVPMYLPLELDNHRISGDTPVFYGAINIYLKEKVPIYRHAPTWLEHLMNSDAMLHMAAKMSGSTTAGGLEEMTLSMLRGEAGRQSKELDQMISFLKDKIKPDLVHLSNALLLGLAGKMKQELGAKIVCSLQDENEWIDPMSESYQDQVWGLIQEKAKDVDYFIATSRYFADRCREKISITEDRIDVVYPGIHFEGYEDSPLPLEPPVLGFLSRLSVCMGLEILFDAFLILKERSGLENLRLHVTGGHTADDKPLLNRIRKQVREKEIENDYRIFQTFHKLDRIEFLKTLTLLSVPVPAGEAFGTYQVEALAAGVPVVQPNVGGFPEFVQSTGGGIIYEPNDARTLAEHILDLLRHPDRLKDLSLQGKKTVREQFSIQKMAEDMTNIYERICC